MHVIRGKLEDKDKEIQTLKDEGSNNSDVITQLSDKVTDMLKERYGTKGIGIVGSSNLSLAGMEHNSELNLRTVHGADYDHLVDWFEELWKDGVEYTDHFEIILGNSWAGKIRTPYEIYVKAMYHEVKDKLEGGHDIEPVWGTSFPKFFPFQHKAVDQALTMSELYGGFLLS